MNFFVPSPFANFSGVVPDPAVEQGKGGPISVRNITDNDVLLGRGLSVDRHYGNVQLRFFVAQTAVVNHTKKFKRNEKLFEAAKIVAIIRNLEPPGRFLSENKDTGYWYEAGDITARKKVAQAVRDFLSTVIQEVSDYHTQAVPCSLTDGLFRLTNQNTAAIFSPNILPSNRDVLLPEMGEEFTPALESTVTVNDILLGRGAPRNRHCGNVQFRNVIARNLSLYQNAKDKGLVADEIVKLLSTLNPPGRFLCFNKEKGCWEEVGNVKAIRNKIEQAFRDASYAPYRG